MKQDATQSRRRVRAKPSTATANLRKPARLNTEQRRMLRLMRANRVPWCLHKRMAEALLQRGLVMQSGVCCKEHGDPMFVLTEAP